MPCMPRWICTYPSSPSFTPGEGPTPPQVGPGIFAHSSSFGSLPASKPGEKKVALPCLGTLTLSSAMNPSLVGNIIAAILIHLAPCAALTTTVTDLPGNSSPPEFCTSTTRWLPFKVVVNGPISPSSAIEARSSLAGEPSSKIETSLR
jgi:hypothetical protein